MQALAGVPQAISLFGQLPQALFTHIAPMGHAGLPASVAVVDRWWCRRRRCCRRSCAAGQAQLPETHEAPVAQAWFAVPVAARRSCWDRWRCRDAAAGARDQRPRCRRRRRREVPEIMHYEPAPVWQTLPHAPQLKLSVVSLTHAPLHVFGRLDGHPQVPDVQTPLMLHGVRTSCSRCGLVGGVLAAVRAGRRARRAAAGRGPAVRHLADRAREALRAAGAAVGRDRCLVLVQTGWRGSASDADEQLQMPAGARRALKYARCRPHDPQLLVSVPVSVQTLLQLSGVGGTPCRRGHCWRSRGHRRSRGIARARGPGELELEPISSVPPPLEKPPLVPKELEGGGGGGARSSSWSSRARGLRRWGAGPPRRCRAVVGAGGGHSCYRRSRSPRPAARSAATASVSHERRFIRLLLLRFQAARARRKEPELMRCPPR